MRVDESQPESTWEFQAKQKQGFEHSATLIHTHLRICSNLAVS